ncbi:MAG: Ku protein [Desulfovibrionaceae bacterium]|nr:Ku protein [Desulfovibrionaceae bacterium]
MNNAINPKRRNLFRIGLYTCGNTRSHTENDIRFNQLNKENMSRIKYKKVDAVTGKEVDNENIVKGYQYEKDSYVVIKDEEFEKIKTEKDRTIQILQFSDLHEIPTLYFDRAYYVLSEKGGERAFNLLRRAMSEENKVAIGRTVLGNSETMLTLLPQKNALLMETMFFYDEIKPLPRTATPAEPTADELKMARLLISDMDRPFEPANYQDEYLKRLESLIALKIEGGEVKAVKQNQPGKIINLMDALKASIEQNKTERRKNRKNTAKRMAG